ncbi:hypothetical protein [Methylobacterium komagatae]
MRIVLAGALVAASVLTAVPAFAQTIELGPRGPSIDLRSRGERERDFRREQYRRDREAERRYYRRERYRDEGYGDRYERREYRRGYGY